MVMAVTSACCGWQTATATPGGGVRGVSGKHIRAVYEQQIGSLRASLSWLFHSTARRSPIRLKLILVSWFWLVGRSCLSQGTKFDLSFQERRSITVDLANFTLDVKFEVLRDPFFENGDIVEESSVELSYRFVFCVVGLVCW